MPEIPAGDFVLGLDLGANSLGWAIAKLKDGRPAQMVRTGARVFESAMDGAFESGKEESRNRVRREVRLQRRQLWRRGRRLKKIFNFLQRSGLLPRSDCPTAQDRQKLINDLDGEIRKSPWLKSKVGPGIYPEPEHVLPYILRAAALEEKLEPHMLGRAIYHLAQRRGFLSNRKQGAQKDDDGVVKPAITELRRAMQDSGSRTLGEYFARLSPSEKRIRMRWTARDMYRDEFTKILEAQAHHHPGLLTDERRKLLFRAIFHQRPLKFDENTIGKCEWEPGERRAAAYLLISQRFRLLDKVNGLRILPPGETECPLTPADRERLVQELEREGDRTFAQVRTLLGLTKQYAFNLERGGDKKLPGNRTASQFYKALGQRWLDMSAAERDRMVEYVHSFEKDEKLAPAAQQKFGLDSAVAAKFAEISLEPEYLSLSLRAMERTLPLLEQGIPLAAARKQIYPESFKAKEVVDLLPPVSDCAEIRNPAVMRSLTELRKVVNAIVRQYGKPAEIHIELARDLRKPRKARAEISEKNREMEKVRRQAAERITRDVHIPSPSRGDIRKVLLADECGWHCPYSGRQMSMAALFSESQFDFEHIIPFSRSLDDSFTNLTLCYHEENRNRKGNKTPHEAYAGDAARYEEVLARVAQFKGSRHMVAEKLRRFKMGSEEVEELLSGFSARQLGDTAYASRLAAAYVGRLYGGTVDHDGRKRVLTPSGQITAYLRNEWKLNGILNDGATARGGREIKTRDDHRHHAVDAVVIALAGDAVVKALSDAAQRAPMERRRRFASLQAPWNDFVASVRAHIENIVVSHRVSKKVSGALHEETLYGAAGSKDVRHVRKALSSLSVPELEHIVDPSVRERVLAKRQELGGGDPKKVFADEKNLPCFVTKDGRKIPIKRVRVAKAVPTFAISGGMAARNVASESNHHIEIFAELDAGGNEVAWDGEVVPLAEAYRRVRNRLPAVQRDHGPQTRFKFSLAAGETLECDVACGRRGLFVFRKVSGKTIGFAPLNDARQARVMQASRAWLWSTPEKLRERNARKTVVGPLGERNQAHD